MADELPPEPPEAQEMSEEELRARLAEELKRIQVRDVLLQTVVTLINLGGQRLGLTEDTREARDLEQARAAIEAVRALVPLLEQGDSREGPEQLAPVRDALAQLQMAYAREAGASEAGGTSEHAERPAGEPRGEQSGAVKGRDRGDSGLWVPPGSGT
ncbi:MAG: hypothetical protein WDZ37_00625 [Solirubrobacterales bacterium]